MQMCRIIRAFTGCQWDKYQNFMYWLIFLVGICYNLIGHIRTFFRVKFWIFFLSINLNMPFGCSKEPSHWDGSFEYTQYTIWLRNKNNNIQLHTLIWQPGYMHLIMNLSVSLKTKFFKGDKRNIAIFLVEKSILSLFMTLIFFQSFQITLLNSSWL